MAISLTVINILIISSTGLLSEGTTVGDVVWTHIAGSLSSSTSEHSQKTVDAGSQSSVKDSEESTEVLAGTVQDENKATIATVDYSSVYNCVLYGVPHIAMVAPPV